MVLVHAGHPNSVVLDALGGVTCHGNGGLPVGLLDNAVFDSATFTLGPGDRLMLYTDGITECENPEGKSLGEAGLGQLLQGRWFLGFVMFVLTALLWLVLLGWIIHLWSIIDAAVYERPALRWERGYYRRVY